MTLTSSWCGCHQDQPNPPIRLCYSLHGLWVEIPNYQSLESLTQQSWQNALADALVTLQQVRYTVMYSGSAALRTLSLPDHGKMNRAVSSLQLELDRQLQVVEQNLALLTILLSPEKKPIVSESDKSIGTGI